MNHTAHCLHEQNKTEETRKAWAERWPNHCKECSGWGGSTFQESHGFKYGPSETLFDPCECTATRCPRCALPTLDEEFNAPCVGCGWNYDDGLPPFWSELCFCGVEDLL